MQQFLSNRYVQSVAIIVAAIVAAWIVNWTLDRVVRRWTERTKTQLDDRLLQLLHKPIFISVILAGLGIAVTHLTLSWRQQWVTVSLLKSIAIIVWSTFGFRFSEMIRRFLRELGDHSPVPVRTLPLLSNLAKVVIAGLAAYFFLVAWDIDATAWIASAGIIGIALGFAAKDTLANLFAGVFILVDAPYKIGDFILLDSGERGEVTRIGIRSTRLQTRDDVEITVPNAVIGGAKITNESGGHHEKERVRIKIGVAYGTDVDQLRAVLIDIASNHPDVCREPTPRVRFRAFGDSSLDFELLCWIDTPVLRGRVTDALNTAVYKRLNQEKIDIPFPIRDVRIRHEGGSS